MTVQEWRAAVEAMKLGMSIQRTSVFSGVPRCVLMKMVSLSEVPRWR